jgi:preprotein translocase SecE subunit
MRKVAWPTRGEVINSTIVVVIGIVVMASIIFGMDYLSLNLVDFIFG